MDTRMMVSGLTAEQAFRTVAEGQTVFHVGFQPYSEILSSFAPIGTGAWADEDGGLYMEPCYLTTCFDTAMLIASTEKQPCILILSPSGNDYLYLLQDTSLNREVALLNALNYTAFEDFLLVFSRKPIPHSLIEGKVKVLPCTGEFF